MNGFGFTYKNAGQFVFKDSFQTISQFLGSKKCQEKELQIIENQG